ncbi:hypothetical protein HYT51_02725 [Candidatus Woesearchaeota archaeon]|nr:hypothetical protein [Candidatus Woesearchaeota archaeon]
MKSFGKKKKCSHCKKVKTINSFYKNKSTIDGLEYGCKKCSSLFNKKYRNKSRDKIRDKKKEWNRNNKIRVSTYHKNWRKNNRELNNYHHLARKKLHYAVQAGKVIKQPCSKCKEKAEAHHSNYNKPLDVIWLCHKHHMELHKRIQCQSSEKSKN